MADAILAQSGIYAITNKVNGRQYIGSAVKFKRRFAGHLCNLRANEHHSQKLQRAWNKYGADSFTFHVIEVVPDRALLISREQFWLDKTGCAGHSGYNIRPTAGSPLGTRHSAATKAKISKVKTGISPSEETRAKISEANRGRVCTPESRSKNSASNAGRKRAQSSIEKVRMAKIGTKHTEETRAKMSAAHTGKRKSPETIERMKKKKSPESIAKREATKLAKRLVAQAS